MIMLKTDRAISLPCGLNDIKGFAINYCDFCFLDRSGCRLIKWSPNVQTSETIELERSYLCICYDDREKCYWTIPECNPYLICRLDACFCEVGHITINGGCQQRPVSLCCDACGKGLVICYPGQFAHVEKYGEKTTWEKCKDGKRINLGFIAQSKGRANCYYDGTRQIVELTSQCNEESMELCIQKEYRVVGMTSCCCDHDCKECRFCVLLSKICLHELILVEYSIDFSKEIEEHCCPPPCPPPCPMEPNCGGSYEIMHSIALEEAGIAHILNAEGEKIQKAVACSDNIEQLICVNESVKRTLTQVTLLEGMLYSKLEALVGYHDCYIASNMETVCSPLPCEECANSIDQDL